MKHTTCIRGQSKHHQPGATNKNGETLLHPDGRTVTFQESGQDEQGDYLIVEHRIPNRGRINGPHWHPVLKESFFVKEGHMRFMIDGQETILGPGERTTIHPRQVHQFWNISTDTLVAIHKIRPPGQHLKMFELIHKLECAGKMNKKGIPLDPLWLGVAWECMDGYLAGPPVIVQKIVFGSLARLAKIFGYEN